MKLITTIRRILFYINLGKLANKAHSGDPEKQWIYASYLLYEKGDDKSIKEAYDLIVSASQKGYSNALVMLGGWYFTGGNNLVKKDLDKAFECFQKASQIDNNPQGNYYLAMFYEYYYKDMEKAVEYYDKAAKNKEVRAMSYLGHLHYEGISVKQDYSKALFWFYKYLDTGNNDSLILYQISEMYLNGNGVNKDIEKAQFYKKRAVEAGYDKDNINGDGKIVLTGFLASNFE